MMQIYGFVTDAIPGWKKAAGYFLVVSVIVNALEK